MFKFIYPQKDTFISNHPKLLNRNFGNDEIIEIENQLIFNDSNSTMVPINSRGLIKFNISEISDLIHSGEIKNPKFFLELFTVEAIETPSEYTVYVNPISQSWEVGLGRLYDDVTVSGVSWLYKNSNKDLWKGTVSGSSSFFISNEFLKNNGGGTWYNTIQSKSLDYAFISIPITSVSESFFITSSNSEIYTFSASESIKFVPDSVASASIIISELNDFDRFCISAKEKCCITVINVNTPDDCESEHYIGWGNNNPSVESYTSITFNPQSLYSGKQFIIYDTNTSWSLMASKNQNMPDQKNCNLKFFHVIENDVNYNVTSLSTEINSIENFNITASVYTSSFSESVLRLTSVGLGASGNSAYIWDVQDFEVSQSYTKCGQIVLKDNYLSPRRSLSCRHKNGLWDSTQEADLLDKFTDYDIIKYVDFLYSGSGVGFNHKFNILVDKLSSISNQCGWNISIDNNRITFFSSDSGSVGNSYHIEYNSNIYPFYGGSDTVVYDVPDDINNNFYFMKSTSSLVESVENLSNKINSSLDFIATLTLYNSSSVYLNIVSTQKSVDSDAISFQSGSTIFNLSGSVVLSNIESTTSQSFKMQSSDLNIDVTDIVNSWVYNYIPNEGFIIRHSDENSNIDYGKLRFYSQNTNTIYIPRLTVKWDNQIFNTGSLSEIDLDAENTIYISNIKETYSQSDIVMMKIFIRQQYPNKTFDNKATRYTQSNFIGKDSQFAIQDAESKEFLIPFDEYNKVSCDEKNGSHFILDMKSLPQERYFRILIRVNKNGMSKIFKDNTTFKVIR